MHVAILQTGKLRPTEGEGLAQSHLPGSMLIHCPMLTDHLARMGREVSKAVCNTQRDRNFFLCRVQSLSAGLILLPVLESVVGSVHPALTSMATIPALVDRILEGNAGGGGPTLCCLVFRGVCHLC